MSLLPKSAKSFKDDSYWNQFFEKRGAQAFEWYGDYPELSGILHKYVKTTDNILSVGCGNSKLSESLYDLGYHKNVNIDISNLVIKQMKDKHGTERPELQFLQMDVKNMSFEDGIFSVVIDKGTLDALMPDDSEESINTANDMFKEINRVLRFGGRYICISLLQKHILKQLLESAPKWGWMVRVHRCIEAERQDDTKQFHFPVFVIICTKMKAIPGMRNVLEFVKETDAPVERLESINDLEDLIKSLQQYSILCHQLYTKKMSEDVRIDLFVASKSEPRYTVYVVDGLSKFDVKYGVFIVPQGRETEWLFGTPEGRQQLRESAKCQRLLVTHLNRNHDYESLENVKSELSQRVLDFAPDNLKSSDVPIMSLGENIGVRKVLHKGTSSTTGDYFIEDVENDGGDVFRRLIFASNQNVIQSEAKMKVVKKKKKASKLQIDPSYLACQHHMAMIAGLSMLPAEKLKDKLNLLIVGLGGGSLPSYIQSYLANTILDVVDIDETIVTIAKEWFNFSPNERMRIHIEDGIKFIKSASENGSKYEAILLDVNNKDITEGLSVPPPAFLELDFLKCVKLCLSHSGVLILNLVCWSETLKKSIYDRLFSVFGIFWIKKVPEEVNEIIYCLNNVEMSLSLANCKDNIVKINKMIRQQVNKDLIDVNDAMKLIKIDS